MAGDTKTNGGVLGSYPGGKSGAGVYQRLINLIPCHRVFVSAFAGHCGIVRKIKPAEHTIVIDADPVVCEWWDSWRRSKDGRDLELHHCDSIEWLRHRFGLTGYRADAGSVAGSAGSRLPLDDATSAETFVFCDPPYVLSGRAHGKQYDCELDDSQHASMLRILTAIPAAEASIMLCGYRSSIYAAVDRDWMSIDHQVPTRGGLQQERIWMNYPEPTILHDHRFLGKDRRERERIRRQHATLRKKIENLPPRERAAFLAVARGE